MCFKSTSTHSKATVLSDIHSIEVQWGSSTSPADRVCLLFRKCNFPSTTFGFGVFHQNAHSLSCTELWRLPRFSPVDQIWRHKHNRCAEEGGFTRTCVKGVIISFLMSECIHQTLKKHLRGFQGVFWHGNHGHIFLNMLHTMSTSLTFLNVSFSKPHKNKHLFHTNDDHSLEFTV